jgi:SAM-dependent methyltransferase
VVMGQPKQTGLKESFARQFSQPKGLSGRLALVVMASLNRGINEWAVDRLNVEPGDRVLDIGSGPGLALEAATRRGAAEIAGVDHSELAVRVARRRLHRVKQTPARVERAEAGSLPFPDESFDKILSVNGISPGGGLDEALREAFRVLSPGGTLLLVVRARREGATSTRRLDRSARFGASAEQIATLVRAIEAAGFTNVASALQEVSGEMMSAIAAKKGP